MLNWLNQKKLVGRNVNYVTNHLTRIGRMYEIPTPMANWQRPFNRIVAGYLFCLASGKCGKWKSCKLQKWILVLCLFHSKSILHKMILGWQERITIIHLMQFPLSILSQIYGSMGNYQLWNQYPNHLEFELHAGPKMLGSRSFPCGALAKASSSSSRYFT